MSKFPRYPTDFSAMTTPFEDEDIENLLKQDIKDVAETLDILKKRELNATKAYQHLKDKILFAIGVCNSELDKNKGNSNLETVIKGTIKLLEEILDND